jgi:ectoine hydroxylase
MTGVLKMTALTGAPPTLQQRKQWDEEGYLVLENALAGDQLKRLQAAFDRAAAECKDDWLDKIAKGEAAATFFDIPDPLQRDKIFIDIVDHPAWYGLLQDFTDGETLFLAPQVRTVPLWPMSYTGWHPDVGHSNPLHIKVQIYVDDVTEKSGEFAYVPGSHRLDSGPYARPKFAESMPGHLRLPGKAGTAIVFNSYGWHTAMDNSTSTPRKSIILIYEKRTPEKVKPESFKAIEPYCVTPQRRALFGLEV